MYRQFLLGLALVLTTSCVPPVAGGRTPPKAAEIADPRQLLRQLALDLPDHALPAAPDAPELSVLHAAPPFASAAQSFDDAARATECLTAAVYYEARSEPVDGQRAVAQVVLNRVRDRAFPHSVCGVVYQRNIRGCQFSFSCDGSTRAARDPAAWDRARSVAQAALAGSVFAPVGSATFYHTQAILPWWAPSLSRIGAIGSHIFYRWRGALERALAFRQTYAGVEPDAVSTGGNAPVVASRYVVSEEAGVTIHRERASRVTLSSGVRIHVGSPPRPAPDAGDGATIGEETAPI